MKRGIFIDGKLVIAPVAISTICGHWGMGLMPLTFRPDYLSFLRLMQETKTTELVKSSTYKFRRGNFIWYNPLTYKYAQQIGQSSMLNAYSHTNLGISFNIKMMAIARKLGFNVIPNFAPDFSKETDDIISEVLFAVEMAVAYGFNIMEFVPSCSNRNYCIAHNIKLTAECIVAVKKRWPSFIIIIKKGLQHPTEAVQEWETAGMDILHGINAISFADIFPGKISPLQNVGGGAISGAIIAETALEDNIKSRKAYSGPMIFGGGIMTSEQAKKCFNEGADAISLCTIVRCDMPETRKMIIKYNT